MFEYIAHITSLEKEVAQWKSRVHELEGDILGITSHERLYREVGLSSCCHPEVLKAARRALLASLHPDRFPPHQRGHATTRFQSVQNAFEQIETLRKREGAHF
jgi:hypothetical protein